MGVHVVSGDYEYGSGQRVKDSFSTETHQGEHEPLKEVGIDVAIAGATSLGAKIGLPIVADKAKEVYDAVKGKLGGDAPKVDSNPVDNFIADGEMIGQDGPTYNAVVHDRSDSNLINDKMESAGDAPAWLPDQIVENKTLMPSTKLEMIVNDKQLEKIQKGEPWIGGWASQDKLPDTVQEARDLTAVKKEWKNDDEGSLHVIEFEIETPVTGNSGTANKMYDDMLDKELPGGVKQFEFEDKNMAFDSMKINSVNELKNNDK